MIKNLVEAVKDQASLLTLLTEGLYWDVHPEFALEDAPEIANGVKGTTCRISEIVGHLGNWKVFLVEFQGTYLRKDLRELLASVRRHDRLTASIQTDELIFIVAAEGYSDVRFVLFDQQETGQVKIKSFGWESGRVGRTVIDMNLRRLIYEPKLNWRKAWDVSALTENFYVEFDKVFKTYESLLTLETGDQPPYASVPFPPGENRTLYLQRILNRLLFICFLQRKRWLRFQDRESDYLFALYDSWKAEPSGRTFSNLLRVLFFQGLNEESLERRKAVSHLIGQVPFLNGGLFHQEQFEDEEDLAAQGLAVAPDALFEELLGASGLLRSYNFTVIENYDETDLEVAIDPEMLGRVFEELVTGRHETGSYYTPRPVVSFMCKQALKRYLLGHDELVENHSGIGIDIPTARALLKKLEDVKVLDPACGSGAYLLGMLQELFQIQRALDTSAKQLGDRDDYDRKLLIIQKCIYGADLDRFAVNISHLRLWLALLIEDKRNPLEQPDEPVALPNLRFKVTNGDALTARVSDLSLFERGYLVLAQELADLHQEYFTPPSPGIVKRDPETIERDIEAKQEEIVQEIGSQSPEGALDWQVQFAEVFATGGFDVVVANPPYVRADAQFKHLKNERERQKAIAGWKSYRKMLKESGIYQTLHEKWDLYIPFLERAFQLLAPGGQMIFIVPDTVNVGVYGKLIRQFLVAFSKIVRIDFCSDIPLFSAGVKNTILHVAKDQVLESWSPERFVRSGAEASCFNDCVVALESGYQTSLGVKVFYPQWLVESLPDSFPTLGDICYLSKGMVIHADEKESAGAFKTQDMIVPERDELHPKALVQGRDVGKWRIYGHQYLEWGTARAPSMFSRRTFDELYEVPEKIITLNIGTTDIRVAYDDQQCLHNHSASSVVPWHYLKGVRNRSIALTSCYEDQAGQARPTVPLDRTKRELISEQFEVKYLLAVMNSSTARKDMARRRRSGLNIYADDWRQLRIPPAGSEDQKKIVRLVDQILSLKAADSNAEISELEAEIDRRVEFLYFHADEAADYDTWHAQREKEKGTIIEEIRNLIAGGETNNVEFKETLEFVDRPPAGLAGEALNQWRSTKQKERVHEVLKTICAYLNAGGGTLLIGVHDRGSVPGIESDYGLISRPEDRNTDGFERKIRNLCDARFNRRPVGMLQFSFVVIDGKTVCKIVVLPDHEPYYLDGAYWVRDGNRSITLIDHERDDYIAKRRASGQQ